METDDDGDGDDGHVERETEVGEEGALVGAVVTGIAVCVVEEEGAEEGWDAEDVKAFLLVAGTGRVLVVVLQEGY